MLRGQRMMLCLRKVLPGSVYASPCSIIMFTVTLILPGHDSVEGEQFVETLFTVEDTLC